MNQRDAKKMAAAMMAQWARDRARTGRTYLAEGFFAFSPEVIDYDDTERVARAFDEFADELERRVTGERKPVDPSATIDPDQLSWLDAEEVSA